jgi:hypothetical protein
MIGTSIEEGHTIQWPKENGSKDKICSTKHYTENKRSSNTNPTLDFMQFLLRVWHILSLLPFSFGHCIVCPSSMLVPIIKHIWKLISNSIPLIFGYDWHIRFRKDNVLCIGQLTVATMSLSD